MAVQETVDAVPGPAITPETPPPPATSAARQRRKEKATYTLQIAYEVESGDGDDAKTETAWFDVATLTVPAGTKRATVRERGLQQAGILPPLGAEPLRVRVLDEDSAEETPVDSQLQLRIGGT